MYSISKRDETHWDLMDEDWGGGGQYTGVPLRIAETLYRLGHGELAWNILSRCTRWTERYPYIPQDAFTDYPNDLDEEDMPLEIASGSGVQAILSGLSACGRRWTASSKSPPPTIRNWARRK